MLKNIITAEINEIYSIHTTEFTNLCRILLNNSEYTYLKGVLYYDLNKKQILFITNIDYSHNEYETKYELKSIANLISYGQIYTENISILNLKNSMEDFKNIKYYDNQHIPSNIISKISIEFKKKSIDLIYKINDYKFINIVSFINYIDISNFKATIILTITEFFKNIESIHKNSIYYLIESHFSSLGSSYDSVLLCNDEVNFLNYVSENPEIIELAKSKKNELIKLSKLFLENIENLKLEIPHIVIFKNFQLMFTIKELIILKFNNIKIILNNQYDNNLITFGIAYLIYLNDYDKLIAKLTSKLFNVM